MAGRKQMSKQALRKENKNLKQQLTWLGRVHDHLSDEREYNHEMMSKLSFYLGVPQNFSIETIVEVASHVHDQQQQQRLRFCSYLGIDENSSLQAVEEKILEQKDIIDNFCQQMKKAEEAAKMSLIQK